MNTWLLAVIVIISLSFLLETWVSTLNVKALTPHLPKEFEDIYSKDEYRKSQDYTRANTTLGLVENSWSTVITLTFLLIGGFNHIDLWARGFGLGELPTGLIYIGILAVLSFIISLPFSIYSTFTIEEKFGFNRTTLKTYILDIVKGTALAILIGGPLLALILWFFMETGKYGWLYCWIGVVAFSIIIQFLAPVLIMPLFNKFTPLEDGSLKDRIHTYADEQDFKIQGIFTMDGSKRSSKLNAFFTGFGRFKKIVFFDTLVDKLSEEEIVAVLAHEMGHFKLRHIVKMIISSVLQTGVMFYLLSLFLSMPEISRALGIETPSIYSAVLFFGFVYSPVNLLVSIVFNVVSRKHEFEADNYAAATTSMPESLISSLKKLSQANLSNLTPHPLNVFIHYSHPPLLKRIESLKSFKN